MPSTEDIPQLTCNVGPNAHVYERFACDGDGFEKIQTACLSGVFPQFTSDADVLLAFKQADEASDNPFGNSSYEANSYLTGWKTELEKKSSTIGGGIPADEHLRDRLECSKHVDVGYHVFSDKGKYYPAGEMDTGWVSFKFTQAMHDRLQGATHIHVYLCCGSKNRDFDNPNVHVHFGIQGKVWGTGSALVTDDVQSRCVRVNQPNPVPVFKIGEYFGFRMTAKEGSPPKPAFGEVILFGAFGDEVSKPIKTSVLPVFHGERTPTKSPSRLPTMDRDATYKPSLSPSTVAPQ